MIFIKLNSFVLTPGYGKLYKSTVKLAYSEFLGTPVKTLL